MNGWDVNNLNISRKCSKRVNLSIAREIRLDLLGDASNSLKNIYVLMLGNQTPLLVIPLKDTQIMILILSPHS